MLKAPPSPSQDAEAIGGAVVADTVVMNNLGYFQLQAKPGVRVVYREGCLGRGGTFYILVHRRLVGEELCVSVILEVD